MELFALTIIVFLLLFLGLVGVILPVLPGPILSWLGFFLFAWSHHFQDISLTITLIFLGLVFLVGLLDYILPIVEARKYKASKEGILGASLGLFLGAFFFGPLGIIFGPFIGTLLGEIYNKKTIWTAIKPAKATILSVFVSLLVKMSLIFTMAGLVIFFLLNKTS